MRHFVTISLLLIYLFPAIIAGNPGFPFMEHSGQALNAAAADCSGKAFTPLKEKNSNREVSKHSLPLNVRSHPSSHVFISMIPSRDCLLFLSPVNKKAINIPTTQSFSSGCLRHIWQPPRFSSTS